MYISSSAISNSTHTHIVYCRRKMSLHDALKAGEFSATTIAKERWVIQEFGDRSNKVSCYFCFYMAV